VSNSGSKCSLEGLKKKQMLDIEFTVVWFIVLKKLIKSHMRSGCLCDVRVFQITCWLLSNFATNSCHSRKHQKWSFATLSWWWLCRPVLLSWLSNSL